MSFEGLSALVMPPEFVEGTSYDTYKKEIEIWKLMKTCTASEQGPILFRSLNKNQKAKNAALELTSTEIGSDKGLDLIIAKLDRVYGTENNLKICSVLEKFESFRRSPNMTMTQFSLDFERLHNQVKGYGITYPDGVLAFRIMKSANMSKEHEQLLRATIDTGKFSYETVLEQLRKIFPDISAVNASNLSPTDKAIKVEETYLASSHEPQDAYCSFEDCDALKYENFTDNVHEDDYIPGS